MCVIMHSYAAVVELADGICLESRRAARLRGFKSLPLRSGISKTAAIPIVSTAVFSMLSS